LSRLVVRDFSILEEYLRKYSLVGVVENPESLALMRTAHRDYLSFLQFWAVCADLARDNDLSIFGVSVGTNDSVYVHLSETVSDVGSGLFCCIQGAYKPAHMALRSSIENFLRFGAGVTSATALSIPSVYQLFEVARDAAMFRNPGDKHLLDTLKNAYSELCNFTQRLIPLPPVRPTYGR